MKPAQEITTVFLDVGGVLLTDGWEHHFRAQAAATFHLDRAELEKGHHLTFEAFEVGLRSILHTNHRSTCAQLASLGRRPEEGVVDEAR
jgi:hypothetical protein